MRKRAALPTVEGMHSAARRKEKAMHAALVRVTIDADQAQAAARASTGETLPVICSAPGFVAGYWLEPVDGQAVSLLVFETEEQARQSVVPADSSEAPGVRIDDVDFRHVAVRA
jgi:hypothetical protein